MTYFITTKYLKDTTSLTNNIDIDDLQPLIKTSSDMWVKSILGTYFFNDLLQKFNNQNLTANEIELVKIIKPAIAWRVAADATIELSYQLKNKGIQSQNGDYSNSADYKAIMFNYHHKKDKASFYENRLSEFLMKNKDNYTAFTSSFNNDSSIKGGDNSNFETNIIFI